MLNISHCWYKCRRSKWTVSVLTLHPSWYCFSLIIQLKRLTRRHKPDIIKDFQEDKDGNWCQCFAFSNCNRAPWDTANCFPSNLWQKHSIQNKCLTVAFIDRGCENVMSDCSSLVLYRQSAVTESNRSSNSLNKCCASARKSFLFL